MLGMKSMCLQRTDLEDNIHDKTSFINVNLSSSEDSTMANILIQQQTAAKKTEILLPINRTVDEDIFYFEEDPTSLLNFFQTYVSEPQIPMYSASPQKYINTNGVSDSLQTIYTPLKSQDQDQADHLKSESVQLIHIEDKASYNEVLETDESTIVLEEFNGDHALNASSSLNNERCLRRRKRRTSLTRTSTSNDEVENNKLNLYENIKNNIIAKSPDITETIQQISLEALSLNDNNKKQEYNLLINDESSDKIVPLHRVRGRRLRNRSHLEKSSTPQESTSNSNVHFFVPTETNVSPPPSPPSSPVSLITTVPSSNTSLNTSVGGLKRTSSSGTTKKMVRFADSVGRQLAQVQYIQSLTDDDDTNHFSLLKNNLYIPKALNFDHKPWSFDVELPAKRVPDVRIPKKFFCLYRQPNSEHPDVYLNEIWQSQVKLEYAHMRLKCAVTGEQFLYGTLWVTNSGYAKAVTVRYTFNRWTNIYEYEAQHCCHSNDHRNIDQFEFRIDIPHDVDRIDFVLRYRVNGQEHWDNNHGRNYTLETESAYTPQTTISLPHDCNFDEMRFY